MANVTYGRLDRVLKAFGFAYRGVGEDNRVYTHESTGAVLTFPTFPDDVEAHDRYVEAAGAVLRAYGIATDLDFTTRLQQAG